MIMNWIKGSWDSRHFIFQINVGKRLIRHRTTLDFKIDFESISKFVIQFQSRCMSDPSLSDIDFKNEMALVETIIKSELCKTNLRHGI